MNLISDKEITIRLCSSHVLIKIEHKGLKNYKQISQLKFHELTINCIVI